MLEEYSINTISKMTQTISQLLIIIIILVI